MKIARVQSLCECQATLVAELNEQQAVVRGWAIDRGRGREWVAPANATQRAKSAQVDVGWSCPLCTRNTLRSFNAGALAYRESAPAKAG